MLKTIYSNKLFSNSRQFEYMAEKNKVKFEEMSKAEIEKFLEDGQAKMVKLRFDISSKQIKNHREYRNVKKDIARAMTALKKK